jgi:hypothetical protein
LAGFAQTAKSKNPALFASGVDLKKADGWSGLTFLFDLILEQREIAAQSGNLDHKNRGDEAEQRCQSVRARLG